MVSFTTENITMQVSFITLAEDSNLAKNLQSDSAKIMVPAIMELHKQPAANANCQKVSDYL